MFTKKARSHRTRTSSLTPCPGRDSNPQGKAIRPSNVRVYQFHHLGALTHLLVIEQGNNSGGSCSTFISIKAIKNLLISLTEFSFGFFNGSV